MMTDLPNPLVVAVGRASGKVTLFFDRWAEDRYEAAIRYEHARQNVRECERYGLLVTARALREVRDARAAYDKATAAVAAAETSEGARLRRPGG